MTTNYRITKLVIPLYAHLSFDGEALLSPGVNVLIGKNGSGKTSVLEMIKAVSENQKPRAPTPEELETVAGEILSQIWLDRGEGGSDHY
jgi:AAA15 family ATPase/GTPase